MKWLVVLALVAGCSKKKEEAPPPPNNEPAIPADELERGNDACVAYVAKSCACAETVPAAKQRCDLAKALPEVIRIATEVTMSKDSSPKDVKQASRDIRKTVAECIEETAKLPELGCKL